MDGAAAHPLSRRLSFRPRISAARQLAARHGVLLAVVALAIIGGGGAARALLGSGSSYVATRPIGAALVKSPTSRGGLDVSPSARSDRRADGHQVRPRRDLRHRSHRDEQVRSPDNAGAVASRSFAPISDAPDRDTPERLQALRLSAGGDVSLYRSHRATAIRHRRASRAAHRGTGRQGTGSVAFPVQRLHPASRWISADDEARHRHVPHPWRLDRSSAAPSRRLDTEAGAYSAGEALPQLDPARC